MCALLAWISEPWHHVSSALVAIAAVCILLGAGVYDRSDFRQSIPWDALISIGGIIGMGPVFTYLHIDEWLGRYFTAFIAPHIGNMYILTIVLTIVIYLVRFILVSQLVCITLFTVLLTPLALQAGMSLWVLGFIVYCATNVWNVFYQNPVFIVAYYATHGEMVSHRQMVVFFCGLYGYLLGWPVGFRSLLEDAVSDPLRIAKQAGESLRLLREARHHIGGLFLCRFAFDST